MKARLVLLRRLSSFAGATGFVAVIGLATTWVIIRVVGGDDWGVLAAIQAGAALFGVLVAFGWGTTGAAEVASCPARERPVFFAGSLVTRLYLFLLTYPVMVIVMGNLNPSHVALVAVGSAAYLLPSLGASWYFVGEAKPRRLFLCDILPQMIGLLASIPVVLLTGSLVLAVSTQLVFNVLAVLISARTVLGPNGTTPLEFSPGAAWARLGRQGHAMTTASTSALYVSTPMLVINALIPSSLAQYGMGDRLFRVGLTGFAPVVQFVQGWIPEDGPEHVRHRVIQVARLSPLLSLAGATAVFALGPWAVSLLSSGQIAFGFDLSLPFAIAFLAVSLSQIFGLACLVPLGRLRVLSTSTVLGAVAGIPLLLVGAITGGIHGVAWGLAASEIVVTVYQLCVIVTHLQRTRPNRTSRTQ